jgi:hypothetical protein
MSKIDLLSLFFFDPLHPSLDDVCNDLDSSNKIHTSENIASSSHSNSAHTPTPPNELSNEDYTDPVDLSSNDSLQDGVDTGSNTTDCEQQTWCDCTAPCFCDDEWWSVYSTEEPSWEEEEREMCTKYESNCFALAKEWEEKQRTKTQRSGKEWSRPKRSEKKDKVWPTKRVNANRLKKFELKEDTIREHVSPLHLPFLNNPPIFIMNIV